MQLLRSYFSLPCVYLPSGSKNESTNLKPRCHRAHDEKTDEERGEVRAGERGDEQASKDFQPGGETDERAYGDTGEETQAEIVSFAGHFASDETVAKTGGETGNVAGSETRENGSLSGIYFDAFLDGSFCATRIVIADAFIADIRICCSCRCCCCYNCFYSRHQNR